MITKILFSLALISLIHAAPSMDNPDIPNVNTTHELNSTRVSFLMPLAKARDLFWDGQTDLMLFFVKSPITPELGEVFEEAARKLQGLTKAAVVDYRGSCDMITCGFELENATLPVVGFAYMSKWNTVMHSKMTKNVSVENIVAHYHESAIKKNKTNNIPNTLTPEQKLRFKEIFSDTYEEVMKNDKDIIIFYSASWCDYCEAAQARLLYVLEELGVTDVHLALADAYSNRIDDVVFHGWPIIKLFKKNARNLPVDIDAYSHENIAATLKEHILTK